MINETFERFRSEVIALLDELSILIADIKNPELQEVIKEIQVHVKEPFLFVVVGEIKSGKSSFINALLQADVCRVDPAPCTDVIQEMFYAQQATETEVNPFLRRIGLPIDILKQIAIVDTPGTNTVVRHHQEITERFIPSSGLVLFVFPAKNPHTLSAWELLDFINEEWRKRVVFVLQQADLATEEELRVNRQKVEEYAKERGIDHPRIFSTSAKWEQAKDPRSGFGEIRSFIQETVTGGKNFYLKLKSVLETGESVLKKVYNALTLLQQELESDIAVTERLSQQLDTGRGNSRRNVQYLIDRMIEQYDRVSDDFKAQILDGFSVPALFSRAVRSTFTRRTSVKKWLEELQIQFETQLHTALESAAGEGAVHLAVSFRDLTDNIEREFHRADSVGKQVPVPDVHIGENREDVIADIRNKIKSLATMEIAAESLDAGPASMSSQLVSGSVLTVVGVILLSTHVTLLDITGGILTGIGMLMAGGVLLVKKGRIVRELNRVILENRTRFQQELTEKLTEKVDGIYENLRRSLAPFYDHVDDRKKKIGPLMDRGEDLHKRMIDLMNRIDDTTP
jgi:predicted GTPase